MQTWEPPFSTEMQPAPAWPPPEAPAPKRGRTWVVVALAVVILAALGGGAYWQFGRDKSPSYPKQWDPRVASLVSFVETTRGLKFRHPVKVEFLSVAAFKKRVTTSPDSLSKSDKVKLENSVLFLRALGLVNGNVDLLSQINKTSSEGVLAFYDPETKS